MCIHWRRAPPWSVAGVLTCAGSSKVSIYILNICPWTTDQSSSHPSQTALFIHFSFLIPWELRGGGYIDFSLENPREPFKY